MKNKFLPLAFLLIGSVAYSQVGIGTLLPNNSAQLEIKAENKGILIPRVALTSRADISTITTGNENSLLVFNTTDNTLIKPGYYYWDEVTVTWQKLVNSTDLAAVIDQNDGDITIEVVNSNLVITDVHGNTGEIPLIDLNLVTTLINNNDGTYTYTSENGTTTTIDVPGDVANYFETILQEGPITIGGNTYTTFEEYLTHVVKSNETITTLVNNNNGTYTYVSENGTVTLIDIVGDVANYFDDILNQGPIVVDGNTYNTFEDYLTTIIQSKETITTLNKTLNNGVVVPGSYTYTNESGIVFTFDVLQDVINNFEDIFNNTTNLEELVQYLINTKVGGNVKYDGNNFSYIDQNGNTQSIDFSQIVKANETITTLSFDTTDSILTYINENGANSAVSIDLSSVGIEPWNVLGSTTKASQNTEDIYQMGKVAVGTSNWPVAPSSSNVTLFVEGDLELTGKFWSNTSVYADYVFEKYFTGQSNIKSDYIFNKLSDVKDFIQKNHHLPGVTPIGDLKKTANGYMIDYSKLSNEQLEKIEELYIHTIEQQELIEKQAVEMSELKDRLERLEKLIK